MSSLFGGTPKPKVQTPEPPKFTDPSVAAAREKEKRRISQAKGRSASILTSGSDDVGPGIGIGKKSRLGD